MGGCPKGWWLFFAVCLVAGCLFVWLSPILHVVCLLVVWIIVVVLTVVCLLVVCYLNKLSHTSPSPGIGGGVPCVARDRPGRRLRRRRGGRGGGGRGCGWRRGGGGGASVICSCDGSREAHRWCRWSPAIASCARASLVHRARASLVHRAREGDVVAGGIGCVCLGTRHCRPPLASRVFLSGEGERRGRE